MSSLDPFLLARMQFAANITFHILFPTISISLGWAWTWIVLAELVAAGKVKYEEAVKFADNLVYLNELLKVRGAFK